MSAPGQYETDPHPAPLISYQFLRTSTMKRASVIFAIWYLVVCVCNGTMYFCNFRLPGADEQELATPIVSLCHGIFTD